MFEVLLLYVVGMIALTLLLCDDDDDDDFRGGLGIRT
jgi:hypothetical protein